MRNTTKAVKKVAAKKSPPKPAVKAPTKGVVTKMGRPAKLALASTTPKQQELIQFRSPRYKELEAEMEKLQRELETVKNEERAEALKACMHWINEFEFTAFELGFVKTQVIPPVKTKKSDKTFGAKTVPIKQTIPPKYRDPATGKTWSGRGHQPSWIEGNRDDYLIDKSEKQAEAQEE